MQTVTLESSSPQSICRKAFPACCLYPASGIWRRKGHSGSQGSGEREAEPSYSSRFASPLEKPINCCAWDSPGPPQRTINGMLGLGKVMFLKLGPSIHISAPYHC